MAFVNIISQIIRVTLKHSLKDIRELLQESESSYSVGTVQVVLKGTISSCLDLFACERNEKVSRELLTNHNPEDSPAYDSTWSYRPISQRLWNDLCPLNHPILNDKPSTRNGWRRQSSLSQTCLVTGGWLVRAATQLERKHHDHGRGDCRHHVPCLETFRRKRTQIQVPRAWQILPKSIVSLTSNPKANAAANLEYCTFG